MKLFISYARTDTDAIIELVDLLRTGGHDPWFDHALIVGLNWQDQLFNAIQKCDAFVFVITQDSIESEWCLWEYGQAVDMEKPIIPILLDGEVILPEFLDHKQYADFTEGATGKAVARLLYGLNTIAQQMPRGDVPSVSMPLKGVPSRIDHEVDERFLEAVELAKQHKGISISLLQREMHIGYQRASRMVKRMENEDIIGKYPGGGQLRPLKQVTSHP